MQDHIEEITYEDEMRESFRDYAVSVIVGRALPDVRDGLKPVHRRVLFAMKKMNILPNSPHKKSARIVGEIIGKYHPHGDAAVYDTMVRLAQDFRMNIPLVDGHGNFGSIDGDSPAAMRYTEARLAPASLELLSDLDKDVVDFQDNYDSTEKEPVILPARFPQLLVNGTLGIAVGMRSSIPPHNVQEVIDAFLHYLKKPEAPIEELLEHMPGPDYPTGGIIINTESLRQFYETGEAKAVIRSRVHTEPAPYGKTNVVITEIPYPLSGNKGNLVQELTQMVMSKKLNEVTDVRDESSKEGIRIVLEVKKGTDIDEFLNKLYSMTKVEVTESYQFLAIVNGRPRKLNLKEYFHHYLEFQKEITRRKYRYLYERGMERKEVLEGFLRAVGEIDSIIDAIRGSETTEQMMRCLTKGDTRGIEFSLKKHERKAKTFNYTKRQAQAILDMKLQRLGRLEVETIRREREQLNRSLEKAEVILNDERELIKEIQKEHVSVKKTYARPRRTVLKEMKKAQYAHKKLAENVWVVVDRFGYCKTMNKPAPKRLEAYRFSRLTKDDDRLVAITNKGNAHQIKLSDIPRGKVNDKGTTIHVLAGLERGEFPVFVSIRSELKDKELIFVTRSGFTKRTNGDQLITSRKRIKATELKTGDELVFTGDAGSGKDLLVVTKTGYVGRFPLDAFPVQTKKAKGVKSLSLKQGDAIDMAFLVAEGEDFEFQVRGKTVKASEIPLVKRGGSGRKIE